MSTKTKKYFPCKFSRDCDLRKLFLKMWIRCFILLMVFFWICIGHVTEMLLFSRLSGEKGIANGPTIREIPSVRRRADPTKSQHQVQKMIIKKGIPFWRILPESLKCNASRLAWNTFPAGPWRLCHDSNLFIERIYFFLFLKILLFYNNF